MIRFRRAAYFLAPVLICLIVYWRAPRMWFLNDDFAWLGLPLEVHSARDLLDVLFNTRAQGTVRVLSERLFFLVFSSLFGLHALPYFLWILATWCANLMLASLIGARLTGSRAAGLFAAVLWTTNSNLAVALTWVSAYNQVLCGFLILAAFYSRLRWLESGRRIWIIAEWAAYVAGFGALEIIVMYPFVAAVHALATAPSRSRLSTTTQAEPRASASGYRLLSTLPLFVPAVLFTIAHFLLILKNAGQYYNLAIDKRIPATFLYYLDAVLGPSRLGEYFGRPWRMPGIIATVAIGIALLTFLLWRVRRSQYVALFCLGWFVLFLAPVAPLPEHLTDYYLTVPLAGLAWLGGWAIVSAWHAGGTLRGLTVILAAAYFAGSIAETNAVTHWYLERSSRLRTVVFEVADVKREHPGSAVLLLGVDNPLFQSGFQDDPFRLIGVRAYLAPGSEKTIQAREDLGGVAHYQISPAQALDLVEHGGARVLSVASAEPRDVTRAFETVLRADPLARRRDFVDVADPFYSSLLGPTWYPAEKGFRWMPKTATVKLSGPISPSQRLYVTGYAPGAVLAAGTVTLHFTAAGLDLGSVTLRRPNEPFSLNFALPPELVGRDFIEITVEVDKPYRPPGEIRDLGMVFGTFGIH